MLEGAHRGEFSVLVVWAVDRLCRQGIEELLRLFRELRERNVSLVSHQEPWLNGTDATSELLAAVAAWVATQESVRRSERTRAGLARRKAQGKPIGGAASKRGKDKRPRETEGYKQCRVLRRRSTLRQTLPVHPRLAVPGVRGAWNAAVRWSSGMVTPLVRELLSPRRGPVGLGGPGAGVKSRAAVSGHWGTDVRVTIACVPAIAVTFARIDPRPTAVIGQTTTWEEFPSVWGRLLDEVYGFVRTRTHLATGDGAELWQNVMLYKDDRPDV